MRLMILAVILTVVAASVADAQTTNYSNGLPLRKWRPFKPDGSNTTYTEVQQEQAPAYNYHPQQQQSRGPIYSPYAMIRYDAGEKLPAPLDRGPNRPSVEAEAPRPHFLPPPAPGTPSLGLGASTIDVDPLAKPGR